MVILMENESVRDLSAEIRKCRMLSTSKERKHAIAEILYNAAAGDYFNDGMDIWTKQDDTPGAVWEASVDNYGYYGDDLVGILAHDRITEADSRTYIPAFGYDIYRQQDGTYNVVNGDGDTVYTASTTLDAKKWCKDHKRSDRYNAKGEWDWNRPHKFYGEARMFYNDESMGEFVERSYDDEGTGYQIRMKDGKYFLYREYSPCKWEYIVDGSYSRVRDRMIQEIHNINTSLIE